jgi:D-sedoheptulose 7-phosphate isomerase
MTGTATDSLVDYRLKRTFEEAAGPADYVARVSRRMIELLEALDAQAVARVADALEEAGEAGNTIFVVGNGGSAAVASHFVNDLGVNSLVDGKKGFRVYSLTDNMSSLTAVANDLSYDDVFARQLQCNLQAGDVLIAMSVSGNSENIIRAVEYANEAGGFTIGFTGFDGGRLARSARHCVHLPTTKDEYGPVEDMFSIVCHLLSSFVSMRRGRFLHH